MTRFTPLLAAAIAAAMFLPVGSATWYSYGSMEPDTHYDREGPYMWTDPPGQATARVYFNAYINQYPAGTVDPNSATLGSRVQSPGTETFNAILGVWVDCNHDGYIGMADGALLEYRAEASAASGHAIDTTICPVTPDTPDNTGKIHNDGNWITELIPIAPVTPDTMANRTNYRMLADPSVKIWADFGEPKTPAVTSTAPPSGDCAAFTVIPPFGYGATRSTGSILGQVDCDDGNAVWHAQALLASTDPTGTIGKLPSGKTLYQPGGPLFVDIFGTQQACKDGGSEPCSTGSNAIASGEFDCSKYAVDQTVIVPDPTGQVGDQTVHVKLHQPGVPRLNAGGSIAATYNETHNEAPSVDNCDNSDGSGNWYGNGLTERGATQGGNIVGAKTSPTFEASYGGAPTRQPCDARTALFYANESVITLGLPDPSADPAIVPPALCGTALFGGLGPGYVGQIVFDGSNQWWLGQNFLGSTPAMNLPSVNRNDLPPTVKANDTFTTMNATFYAYTGLSGVDLPGAVGTYGIEFCTNGIGANAPITNGWDCNPADWNLNPSTGKKLDDAANRGNVGDAYNLRDVDCYDTTLVAAGSSANPTHQDIGARSVPLVNDPSHGCS